MNVDRPRTREIMVDSALVHQHRLELVVRYPPDLQALFLVNFASCFISSTQLEQAFPSHAERAEFIFVVPDVSALEFVDEVIAVELTLQRDLPRSLPFKRCYPAQDARLDDLLRVLCVLPGNVLTQLELRADGFND